jgi:hypothetical protein
METINVEYFNKHVNNPNVRGYVANFQERFDKHNQIKPKFRLVVTYKHRPYRSV